MSTQNEAQDRAQKALDAFMSLSKAFTSFHTDEHAILQIAYDHIRTVLNAQNFCVVLHDKRTDRLSVALAFQNGEPVREENLIALLSFLGKQKIAILRKTQQPLLVSSRRAAEERYPDDPALSSFLGVPMNVGGLVADQKQSDSVKTIGMMIAYSDHEHEYNEEDVKLLEMFADMVSNEFENAHQHQRFEILSTVQQRLAIGKTEHDTLIESKEQLLQLVNEQIQQLKEIDTRNFVIVLREPKSKELRLELWHQNGQPLHVESKEVRQQFFQQIRRSTIEKIVALSPGERLLLKNRKAIAEEFLSPGKSEAYASWLGVPMRVKGDRVLGVFIVYHETQEDAYDELDAQILDMVSDQAAIALENLRLIELEKKQRQNKEHARQQAEVLKEVARIASSSLDLRIVAEKIFEQLAHVLEYTSVSLQAIDNDERTIIGYRGLVHAEYPPTLLRKLSEDRLISKIVESKKPVVLSDTKQSPLWDDFEETRQINSWIGAPLIVQDQVIGLLTVDHTQAGYYNQALEELVVAFANQVAPALLNARLYHHLERRLMERVNDFNALRNIYAAVGSSALQEVLQHILETGIRLTSSDYADIWLYNSETHEIREEVDYHHQRSEALYRQGSLQFNIFDKKSIVGHVVTTRTPYLCKDVTNDSYFLSVEANVKSELAVPIISRQEKNHEKIVLGVLNFESLKLDAFTDEHYQLVEALAEQAAIAIHNAQLTEMQQKQNQRQAALIELGKTLTSKIDVSEQDILNAIYQSASLLMNTDTMYIALYDEQTKNVRFGLVYENGKPADIPNTPKWKGREVNQRGKTEWIIRTKQPILLKTLQEFRNWYHESDSDHSGINEEASWLGVPMIAANKVIGVIGVHHDTKEYVYNEGDRDFLLSLANQAAIALEKATLYKELELRVQERTAELTKAYNLLQTLIDTLPDLVYVKDTEGKFIHANNKVVRSLGAIALSNLIGKTDFDFQSHELATQYYADEQKVIAGQPQINKEEQHIDQETFAERWLLSTKVPLRDKQDKIIGLVGINRDITDLKKIQDRQKVLVDLAQKLTSNIDQTEDNILHLLYKNASELMDTNNMYIALHDKATDEVRFPLAYKNSQPISIDPRKKGKGRTEEIIKTGQLIFIKTRKESEEWYNKQGHQDYIGDVLASWIGVPIKFGEEVLGVVATYHPSKDYVYTEDDVEILQIMANIVSISLQNSKLFQRIKRQLDLRIHDLQALKDIYAAIGDTSSLLTQIVAKAVELTSADYGDIWSIDRKYQNLIFEGEWKSKRLGGAIPNQGQKISTNEKRSIVGYVAKSGQSYLCQDTSHDEHYWEVLDNIHSELAVPLRYERKLFGVLNLESSELAAFTDDHKRLLEALGNQAAIAMQLASLNKRKDILIGLSYVLNSRSNITEEMIFDSLYQNASELMDTANMYIALFDETTDAIHFPLLFENGEKKTISSRPIYREKKGRTEEIILTKQSIFIQTQKNQQNGIKSQVVRNLEDLRHLRGLGFQ